MAQLELFIESILSLWFFYPVLGFFVLGDALFPLLPAETLITLAASWSGSRGVPDVWLVFTTGLVAALIGDNLCYLLGDRMHRAGRRLRRIPGAAKISAGVGWVEQAVELKPGFTIIVARFVPWARWIVTIILGSKRYPWWKFAIFDAIGALIWVGQACCVGYLGGWLVSDYPIIGVALGLALGGLVGWSIDKLGSHYKEFRAVKSATATF